MEPVTKQTTKVCPKCGSKELIKYYSTNLKQCSVCHTTIPWVLDKGQKPLFK